jgi:translation initiation factor IF-2
MVGLLDPTLKEEFLGRAEVRETFKVPKAGLVAGCYITDGKVPYGSEVRLLRDSTVVYEGKISSLRRFKEDTSEVREGYECGIALERFQDIKIGDIIEAYRIEKVAAQSL